MTVAATRPVTLLSDADLAAEIVAVELEHTALEGGATRTARGVGTLTLLLAVDRHKRLVEEYERRAEIAATGRGE